MDPTRELPQLVDRELHLALRLLQEDRGAQWLALYDAGGVAKVKRQPGQAELRAVMEIVLEPTSGVVRR